MESSTLKVCIQCEYVLLRRIGAESEDQGAHTFRDRLSSGRMAEITVSYPDNRVMVRMSNIEWGAEVASELRGLDRYQGSDLSADARAVVEPLLTEIRNSVRQALSLLKYHLRHFNVRESLFSIKSETWSTQDGETRDLPTTSSVTVQMSSVQPLNDQARRAMQGALTAGASPLVAMRHLHRAKDESQPHHKWIDATIAAELAVKEVLCRARPDIENLLIEMPSPPISKMYGPLLKFYLGEESPYRKKLIVGQEKRNSLVHRPNALHVDGQEAIDYVDTVESAIFHLLSLLYPKDELIRLARLHTA